MILSVPVPDLKTYRDDPQHVLNHPYACPGCGHRPLARHDTRQRWFYSATERFRSPVFRMLCAACGITVTLLPDVLVPRFRYVAELIQQAVTGYLTTTDSYRALAIQINGGVRQGMDSITDALLTERMSPSYQRIHAWVRHVSDQAAAIAQDLATWILRLRPDSDLLHLLATPTHAIAAKARGEPRRLALRAAALLHTLLTQAPELSHSGPWLARLSTLVPRLRGHRKPPRARGDPPST